MSRSISTQSCPKCRDMCRDSRGDNLICYIDGSAHCFACNYHKFPEAWQRWTKEEKVDHTNEKVLPSDFIREIPSAGWKWLLQYGLSYSYWLPHCGYSAKEERLILTVGESPEFSIGRWIGESSSKRSPEMDRSRISESSVGRRGTARRVEGKVPTNGEGSNVPMASTASSMGEEMVCGGSDRILRKDPVKWKAYGDCHRTAHVFGDYTTSKQIVLTEDLISAHKVSQVNACIPLFGTNLSTPVITIIRYIGLPIVLWLDKDQEGRVQKKALNLSTLTNLPVSYIFTDDDPKLIPINEIDKILT